MMIRALDIYREKQKLDDLFKLVKDMPIDEKIQ